MRTALALLALVTATAVHGQAREILPGVELPAGAEIESRVSGDLNGDRLEDAAYVAHNADSRALTVLLSVRGEFDFQYRAEVLLLDPAPLGPGTLSLEAGVITFEDLTGGTTAVSSTRRFRFDGRGKRMRLIGLDATVYSRTFAHDGFEASWNLLTGSATTRELRLDRSNGDAAYDPVRERSFTRRIRPQWLADAPDPETMLEEMRDS